MSIPFATSPSAFSLLELQHEVVGAVGGGGGGSNNVDARIRAAVVRAELSAAAIRNDALVGYAPSGKAPPTHSCSPLHLREEAECIRG